MIETSSVDHSHSLMLGVGSQRAGSTLLYRLLNKSMKGLFMHPVKELHFFDSIHHLRPRDALQTFSKHELARLSSQHGDLTTAESTGNKRLICEIRTYKILSEREINEVSYLDLFRPCLMHYNWLGEVTPEYMLLNEEQLRGISNQFTGRVLPILMIRNPAKRFLSAFKLRHFYMRPDDRPVPDNETLQRNLNFLLERGEEDRWVNTQLQFNQYREAHQRLEAVFGDDVIVLSLDTLTQQPEQTFKMLEQQIGLELDRKSAETCLKYKANETDIQLELDQATNENLQTFFSNALKDAEELCAGKLKL